MKVILTAEVKGKGHEGDIVEVARGYAVNYLLPRKMAVQATAGAVKQLEARMSNIRKRNETRMTDAQSIAARIEGKVVVIEAKVGQDGKLFGSVTTLMIEEAAAAQLGVDIDHKRVHLARPIKIAGAHDVSVSIFGEVKATLVVKVVAEGAAADAVAEAAAPVVEVAETVEAAEPVEEVAEVAEVAEEADDDESEDDENE